MLQDNYLLAAGWLMILIGLIHSVLGEKLIFSRMRGKGLVPTNGAPLLKERHVGILWASWHLVTLFAWCMAVMLLLPSESTLDRQWPDQITQVIALGMTGGALLVLIGTRAKHPGWIGMLIIAILISLA